MILTARDETESDAARAARLIAEFPPAPHAVGKPCGGCPG